MLGPVIAFFARRSSAAKWGGIAAIGALVLGTVYMKGIGHERRAVERQNVEAGASPTSGALDWSECRRLDGVYDFDTGDCTGPR